MSKKEAFPLSVYDFYKKNGTDTTVYPDGPSMTRQEFAEECDINTIMKRYEGRDIGAIMRSDIEPMYVDFTSVPNDLMGYMEKMREAELAFMTLPASVRREFDNNALAFVDYASDPESLDQMRTWGLAPPAKPQEAAPPKAAEGAPAAPAASPGGSPLAAPAAAPKAP